MIRKRDRLPPKTRHRPKTSAGSKGVSLLPVEIELAIEVMPCQAARRIYEPADKKDPCTYFAEWGVYHSYRYKDAGPPPSPGIEHPAVYGGKTFLVPELLSGCRKAPILAVGINPNLPGYWRATRNAINPLLDDVLQYAHYFRYRAVDKLQILPAEYQKLLGSHPDGPMVKRPLTEIGSPVSIATTPVSMYEIYQGLLDSLAERMRWRTHQLRVGEDLSYGNMVACPSAKWLTTRDSSNPKMPVMSPGTVTGIVQNCFHSRRYFLRQLFQSLPCVLIVLSRATADAFLAAMRPNMSGELPASRDDASTWLRKKCYLNFGKTTAGKNLSARVIFAPHATGDPEKFKALREQLVDSLEEEARAGRLKFNSDTGHLARPLGKCEFCTNALYSIGPCDYLSELKPISSAAGRPQSLGAEPIVPPEKAEQQLLLSRFLRKAGKRPRLESLDQSPFVIVGHS
jgi:hypothetical protein